MTNKYRGIVIHEGQELTFKQMNQYAHQMDLLDIYNNKNTLMGKKYLYPLIIENELLSFEQLEQYENECKALDEFDEDKSIRSMVHMLFSGQEALGSISKNASLYRWVDTIITANLYRINARAAISNKLDERFQPIEELNTIAEKKAHHIIQEIIKLTPETQLPFPF